MSIKVCPRTLKIFYSTFILAIFIINIRLIQYYVFNEFFAIIKTPLIINYKNMFNLTPLLYDFKDLEPHISAQTMELHCSKHHQAYVNKLNELIAGTGLESKSLEEIINTTFNDSAKTAIFNNAGQHYNHEIFWQSLRPASADNNIPETLMKMIERDFTSLDGLLVEFKKEAGAQFGSGWIWLVLVDDKLKVLKTANGEPAFVHGVKPLLALDVWEHSYYLDYQNKRLEFVEAVFNSLFNWGFAAKQAGL
jgi:superoxide dismutase, Fe-Mn family